jgi:nucleotide-binding universal stress UspA family protein
VSVPKEGHGAEPAADRGSGHGQVAVGVRAAAAAGGLLEAGFGAAESRGARLLVVHAWQLPDAYDDVVVARSHSGARAREVEEELDPLLELYRARHPSVPVELSVVHQQPARALLRVAAGSDLLLLLRAAHGLPFLAHLGGTGRTVLHHAPCPVEVVPPHAVLAEVRVGHGARSGDAGPRGSTL